MSQVSEALRPDDMQAADAMTVAVDAQHMKKVLSRDASDHEGLHTPISSLVEVQTPSDDQEGAERSEDQLNDPKENTQRNGSDPTGYEWYCHRDSRANLEKLAGNPSNSSLPCTGSAGEAFCGKGTGGQQANLIEVARRFYGMKEPQAGFDGEKIEVPIGSIGRIMNADRTEAENNKHPDFKRFALIHMRTNVGYGRETFMGNIWVPQCSWPNMVRLDENNLGDRSKWWFAWVRTHPCQSWCATCGPKFVGGDNVNASQAKHKVWLDREPAPKEFGGCDFQFDCVDAIPERVNSAFLKTARTAADDYVPQEHDVQQMCAVCGYQAPEETKLKFKGKSTERDKCFKTDGG